MVTLVTLICVSFIRKNIGNYSPLTGALESVSITPVHRVATGRCTELEYKTRQGRARQDNSEAFVLIESVAHMLKA